jgi:flagellar biosynthesis GTPase FlhF
MQINELVQVALLEEVAEKLLGNRLGEVFRVAAEGKLSPRIREVFGGLAELLSSKQRELERAG